MFLTSLCVRAVRERLMLDQFMLRVMAITGLTECEANDFALAVTPHFFDEALGMLAEGWPVEKVQRVLSDTTLAAAWRLGFAGREFVRAVVGIESMAPLTADELRAMLVDK